MSGVRTKIGVPIVTDFTANPLGGTDFIINVTTGYAYSMKTNGDVYHIGGSGGAAWGAITGTLANQTDLNNALTAKANTSSLATVATSGAYNDLTGRPTLGSAAAENVGAFDAAGTASSAVSTHVALPDPHTQYALQADLASVAITGAYASLSGLPTLFDGVYSSLANIPATFPPSAHKVSHQDGGSDELALDASQTTTGTFAMARLASGTPTGSKFVRDDGTLAVPAGGSFAATQATVTLPYSSCTHSVNVVDATVTPASKIVLSLAGVPETDTNSGDAVDLIAMQAVPGSGAFTFQASFLTPAGGPLTINYGVG